MNTSRLRRSVAVVVGLLVIASMLIACAPATPQTIEKQVVQTVVVEKKVVETVMVEKKVTEVPGTPKRGGTLNWTHTADVKTFDPYFLQTNLIPIVVTMYDGLIYYDYDQKTLTLVAKPALAESWKVSQDNKTLTLKLRKGVKWHNGDEFKAEHAVYNLTRAQDTKRGGHMAPQFANVESVKALDDYTVEIKYKDVAHGKFDALARLKMIHPASEATIEKTGIGTGPFKFSEWVPGDHLTLVRFENYWEMGFDGKPLPYLDKVVFKFIADSQIALVNFEAGQFDLTTFVAAKDVARLGLNPKYQVVSNMSAAFYLFGLKPTSATAKPLQDKKVRQAIAHAVDRQKIVSTVFYGLTVPQCAEFPWNWTYEADLQNHAMCKFDLEQSKALLKEAGYPDGFEFTTLTWTGSPEYVDYMQIIQQDLAKVGIKMKIEPAPDLARYYSGDFEAVAAMFNYTNRDPSAAFTQGSNLRPINSPYGIDKAPFYNRYVELINKSSAEIEQAKRKPIYRELQELLLDESWHIIVARAPFMNVQTRRIQNLNTFSTGQLEFNFTSVWLSQ